MLLPYTIIRIIKRMREEDSKYSVYYSRNKEPEVPPGIDWNIKENLKEFSKVLGFCGAIALGWFAYRGFPTQERQEELRMNEVARQVLPNHSNQQYTVEVDGQPINVSVVNWIETFSETRRTPQNNYIPKYETWTVITGYNLRLITSGGTRWNSERWQQRPRRNYNHEDACYNFYSGPDDDARILESLEFRTFANQYRRVLVDTLSNKDALQKKYQSMLEEIAAKTR